MKIRINEDHVKAVGKAGLKIGKAIVVEGTKAVILKGAQQVVMTSFDEGFEGVRNLKLDDVLQGKKKDKKVKEFEFNLFKRKKKGKTEVEVNVESNDIYNSPESAVEDVNIELDIGMDSKGV